MSRISSQSPLSRGPDLPTGGRNISPGTFTPVANNSAGEILNLLSAAAGTISTVQNVSNRRTSEQEADAYQMTQANLIRLREQANRDSTFEASFLSAYQAAEDRFGNTQYAANLASLGEPVLTTFQGRADKEFGLAKEGFFMSRVSPVLNERMVPGNETFDSFVNIADPSERFDASREWLTSQINTIAPSFFEGMTPEMQADFNRSLDSEAARYANMARKERETIERGNKLLAQEYTNVAIVGIAADAVSKGFGIGEPPPDVSVPDFQRAVGTNLLTRLEESINAGDVEGVAKYAIGLSNLRQTIPNGDTQTISVINRGVATVTETFVQQAVTTTTNNYIQNTQRAQSPADIADAQQLARQSLVDNYNELFGTSFTSLSEIDPQGNLVQTQVLNRLLDADRSFQTKVQEDNQTVRNALADVATPFNAPQGAANRMADLSQENRNAVIANLFESVISTMGPPSPEDIGLLQRLEDASRDPAAWAGVVTQVFRGTQHEKDAVRAFVDRNQLTTDDGLRIAYEALDVAGGASAISMLITPDDPALGNALNRAFTQADGRPVQASIVQAYVQEYENLRINEQGVQQAIATPEFMTGLLEGSRSIIPFVNGTDKNIVLSPSVSSLLQTIYPVDQDTQQATKNERAAGAFFANFAKNSGIYMYERESPNGTRAVHYTTYPTIPEAAGKSSADTIRALNNPDTAVYRRVSRSVDGETGDLWRRAARLASTTPGAMLTDVEEMRTRLLTERDAGNALISIRPEAADSMGTPIFLTLREEGRSNREIQIGYFNFGQDPVFSQYGPGAFQKYTPARPKSGADEGLSMGVPTRF